jgi:hypothetical protein
MAYTNIIFDDITCIPDFRVPLQVTFGIIERKFKIIGFELVQMAWISSNDSTVTPGVSASVHPECVRHQRPQLVPLCGHELHTIRSLTGNTTRPLCGSYARCPPNAPVVTKAMTIDLMTTHINAPNAIRSLTGNTTRPLCSSYARCPPNAPVVTKAMVIDLMTTHTTNCQCDTTPPLEITTDV